MSIRDDVLRIWHHQMGPVHSIAGFRSNFRVGSKRVNLRTASQKRGDQYWFDVTPEYYAKKLVDYFAYACGSASHVYVIPAYEMERLMEGASLGGQKQVPNFTIYLDRHEFEPAGRSEKRKSIEHYYNLHEQLRK